MRLIVRVENESPVGGPILEDNFVVAFPNIDVDNLSEGWAYFEKTEKPTFDQVGVYQVLENEPEIVLQENGTYKEVWTIRNMTDEEKLAKQNLIKELWTNPVNARLTSWTFNEATCQYEAPVAMPADANEVEYQWVDATQEWVAKPNDGQEYVFNHETEEWEVYVAPE